MIIIIIIMIIIMKRERDWNEDYINPMFTIKDYHVRLNTYPVMKDARYILYRILHKWRMQKLNNELKKLMYWDEEIGCYCSFGCREALFNFRDVNNTCSSIGSSHNYVYKIFTNIGKIIEYEVNDDHIVADLPKKYFMHINDDESEESDEEVVLMDLTT